MTRGLKHKEVDMNELEKAWSELITAIGEEFKIYKLLDCLENKLNKYF